MVKMKTTLVFACFFLCVALCQETFTTGTTLTTLQLLPTNCTDEWNATVTATKDLHVTWSGPDRLAYIHVTFRSAECEGGSVVYAFETRHADVLQLCMNEEYHVNVTLVCENGETESQAFIVWTPPDAPPVPENLTATDVQSQNITLQWDELQAYRGPSLTYQIEWGVNKSDSVKDTVQFYILRHLLPHTSYDVRVRAYVDSLFSNWSTINVNTTIGRPTRPLNLTETVVTNDTITVVWEDPQLYDGRGLILQYTVQWRRFNFTKQEQTTERTMTIKSLDRWTSYAVQVSAWTEEGQGEWTEPIEVETKLGVPPPPTLLADDTKITSSSIGISWESSDDFKTHIRHHTVKWTDFNDTSQTVETTDSSYVIRGLEGFKDYSIAVRSYTVDGYGAWSDTLIVETEIGFASEPMDLYERNFTSSSIEVTWSPPVTPNGPILKYGLRVTNLKNSAIFNDTTPELMYTVVELHPYTNYSIQVCAYTSAGSGNWSAPLIVRTKVGVPGCPRRLRSKTTNSSIELTWDEPVLYVGPILLYAIQWSTEELDVHYYNTSLTFYKLEKLDAATKYTFKARAYTDAGPGNWSKIYQGRTLSGIPFPPQNLCEVNVTNTTIKIKWEEPEPFRGKILSYTIQWRHEGNGTIWFQQTIRKNYLLLNLDPYTFYNVNVAARTTAGVGPWSSIRLQTRVGIPSSPREVKDKSRTAWSLQLTWLTPIPANGPLLNYSILCENPTFSHLAWTDSTDLLVKDLVPFTNYSCTVSASTEVGFGPLSAAWLARTDIAKPSAPTNLTVMTTTPNSLLMIWSKPDHPNGPLLNYTIRWYFSAEDISTEFNPHESTSASNYFRIDGLNPYTNYSIEVCAQTEAGFGPWSETLVKTTGIAIPPPATLSSVRVLSPRCIVIEWQTLGQYPGPTTYFLEVWRKPGPCEGSTQSIQETRVQGQAVSSRWGQRTRDRIDDLTPYTNYSVLVYMSTAAGSGSVVVSDTFLTFSDVPGAPRQVIADCSQNTEIEVKWKPPLKPNGKLVQYVVTYGEEYYEMQEVVIETSHQCSEHSITLTHLQPERKYKVYVRARAQNVSEEGDIAQRMGYCILPPGVPPLRKNFVFKAKPQSPYILQFSWDYDLFSDSMGELINYAVLVGLSEAVGNATSGKKPQTYPPWYNFSIFQFDFYQASPLQWNPFDKEKKDPLNCEHLATGMVCSIGLDDECDETYCNGPLRPKTTYGIKLRAYTKGGYSETHPIFATTDSPPSTSLSVVVGILVMCLLVGSATYLMLRRKDDLIRLKKRFQKRFLHSAVTSAPTPQVDHVEMQPASSPLSVKSFGAHFRHMMSDSHFGFSHEFETLQGSCPKFTSTVAELEGNRGKNRWLNILPYDHSRVKLLPLGDEPASDYVNANYIPGELSLREYIATQGPLPATLDDFWRMVWEQSVTMIVMLTQCVERGKRKCEQYWPPLGESHLYGDLSVDTVSESNLSCYCIRLFHLKLGTQERKVKQMHFTHWPDFGCPEKPEDLIHFIGAIREHLPRIRPGPIVVHCSAGVGRTGTLIAVDRLSQHLACSDVIDIYNTVVDMRQHRTNMVQTEDQYIFIHLCVQHLLDELNQPSDEHLEAIYMNTGLEKDTDL